jgi:hypothetical protein
MDNILTFDEFINEGDSFGARLKEWFARRQNTSQAKSLAKKAMEYQSLQLKINSYKKKVKNSVAKETLTTASSLCEFNKTNFLELASLTNAYYEKTKNIIKKLKI